MAKKGFIANTLTPFVGDANTQTPEFKSFLVNVGKGVTETTYGLSIARHHSSFRPLTVSPPRPRRGTTREEVAKLIDVTTCIGCKACQVACSEWNDIRDEVGNNVGVYDNPADLTAKSWTVMRFSEVEQNDKLEWLIRKDGCMHCADPGCLKACPAEGAIIQYANGIVDFQSEQCIGCGYCIAGCPFNVPRLNPEDNRVYKCTLCVDRVTVGQEPACVKTCPTGAIHFGSKEDMKTLAGERVAELKTRGYDNAGLYDPAGVGGTHVMYVLHHADKPNLYHGLPENPEISETVKFWKGVWKPLAAFGFAATFAASVFHYVGVGPNRAEEEDDNLHEEKDEVRK
ncbi:formate dehydrogenase-O subunit beta [Salmonella enterica subsp. enterica]|nr:formate dehydrogenase-O subunit beta [Salmonella enterica subsp. enterica]